LPELVVVDLLGRDMTFTGRTEIWQRVLSVDINPLLGVGYYSFWMIQRVDWVALGWMGQLNEAHNGYIETYLNSGLVGLSLLSVLLMTALRRVGKEALCGSEYKAFLLAFILILTIYNFTEAAFNRQSPLWVIGLLVLTVYPLREPSLIGEGEHTGSVLRPSVKGLVAEAVT
jgi:O-antigen ligase